MLTFNTFLRCNIFNVGTQNLPVQEIANLVKQNLGDDIELGGGVLAIKNTGAQSQARFYCESSNAHYAAIQAPAHADFSGNVVLTLPATTGNLVTSAAAADEATALAIALG